MAGKTCRKGAGFLGCCAVSARIKRSLKAFALVGLVGVAAMMAARPFVPFGDGDVTLDPPELLSGDFESETRLRLVQPASDSEIEDALGRPVERVVAVGAGDTLGDLLIRAGVDSPEAAEAIESLKTLYNPRALRAGQKVTVTFERPPHGLGTGDFQSLSLFADPIREVMVSRGSAGFAAREEKRDVELQIARFSGHIRSSLYESAQAVGVPAPVVAQMIRALSYDVDFQREVQAGDAFEVVFEGYYDSLGRLVRSGDILYTSLGSGKTPVALYRHEFNGTWDFFNEKGESAKKALLRTPVDGARISSGFGLRHHPILGFTKMHKGVDFAVPPGTPIMAAGDGTVEMAEFNGAYGNYVRVRHGNGFATAYAHMSRIAQGMRPGKRISQGQIVGFVGSTGRSTGPHLHYEVMQGKAQINPLSIKIPTGTKLAGNDLSRFKTALHSIDSLRNNIAPSTRIAANQPDRHSTATN